VWFFLVRSGHWVLLVWIETAVTCLLTAEI
jgi:hypothetical protein